MLIDKEKVIAEINREIVELRSLRKSWASDEADGLANIKSLVEAIPAVQEMEYYAVYKQGYAPSLFDGEPRANSVAECVDGKVHRVLIRRAE